MSRILLELPIAALPADSPRPGQVTALLVGLGPL